MSYDLMVFEKSKAPKNKNDFMLWYNKQTEWSEEHNYDRVSVTSEALKNWFMEIKEIFPPMAGEQAVDESIYESDNDNLLEHISDYSIGRDVIYACFSRSLAQEAYETVIKLAQKHEVGFFDVSGNEEIIMPDGTRIE